MTFSRLASQTHDTSQKSSRQGAKIDMVICHHMASTNSEATLSEELTGSRQVSSNYIITNTGEIWGVVPEEYRAWTSGATKSQNPADNGKGAAFDRRSITFECADQSTGGSWPISAASQDAIVKLLVDVHQRYGIPLDRDHIVGHRELYTRWGASYATACPGGMDLDDLVSRAVAQLNNATSTETKDDDMARQWLMTNGNNWAITDGIWKRILAGGNDDIQDLIDRGIVTTDDVTRAKSGGLWSSDAQWNTIPTAK